jgi:hypothetical protein
MMMIVTAFRNADNVNQTSPKTTTPPDQFCLYVIPVDSTLKATRAVLDNLQADRCLALLMTHDWRENHDQI